MTTVTAVLGDITTQQVDVVVNAASSAMRGGGGVDGAIHRAGGPAVLRDCIARFPHGLATGDAGWTTAGDLPARWVVHTVGPNYRAGQRDRSLLVSCYRRSLEVADELGARSVAFPLVSAGIYGWPQADAIMAAVDTIAASHTGVEHVRIVAYSQAVFEDVRAALARATPVRILQAVRLLHALGYHRLRVLPGMSASGMHWRVTLTVAGAAGTAGAGSGAGGAVPTLRYTTGATTDFAGGEVTVTSTPESVALLVVAAMPGLTATGDDPGYVAWYDGLMRLVERDGRPPVAYADYFDESGGWEVGWGSGVRYPAPPPAEQG